MESVVNYLEDTEKKLAKEMADLFSKMREQRESIALNGIEDYNDLLPSEFYTDINVSDTDLQERSDNIELILTLQRDLLSSLQEAPSKVYQEDGLPAADLGKIGDYYIDLTTSIVYGPKITATDWGTPVN